MQKPYGGDITVGLSEDGERSWDGRAGHFHLGIDQVGMRWVDPVPETGTVTLDTPFGKTVDVAFHRTTATTIQVVLTGARGSIAVDVTAAE